MATVSATAGMSAAGGMAVAAATAAMRRTVGVGGAVTATRGAAPGAPAILVSETAAGRLIRLTARAN